MNDRAHRVVVLPAALEFEARHGEILMASANRAGLYWPTACAAQAICTRCVTITAPDQASSLSPMAQFEREAIERVRGTAAEAGERLACQARVLGDATVTKKFVRPCRPGDVLPFADR
jgi:2Fe-2S ferredoxin